MSQKELTEALETVHRQLAASEHLDAAEVEKLRATIAQIRAVLDRYTANGGEVAAEMIPDSSHGPIVDHLDQCATLIYRFIATHG